MLQLFSKDLIQGWLAAVPLYFWRDFRVTVAKSSSLMKRQTYVTVQTKNLNNEDDYYCQ